MSIPKPAHAATFYAMLTAALPEAETSGPPDSGIYTGHCGNCGRETTWTLRSRVGRQHIYACLECGGKYLWTAKEQS